MSHSLAADLARVRTATRALAAPLSEADCQAQSMADASPVKWHLAHTTWFFEIFVLARAEPDVPPHHPAYRALFNSYYQGVGAAHPRPERGLLTRPSLAEVLHWREAVDARLAGLIARGVDADLAALLVLGLQHEQQHQELILTDLLHLLSCNPMAPQYRAAPAAAAAAATAPPHWLEQPGGLVDVGAAAGSGFAFDNEQPRHRQWLAPHALASRLVTQGEWLAFMEDGGYTDARWWLAAGWDWRCAQGVTAPLYWRRRSGDWCAFTLHGEQPLAPDTPVHHISYYEADAYAAWAAAQAGAPLRLPTEAEWEHAAAQTPWPATADPTSPTTALTPPPAAAGIGLQQLHGAVWQWTRSAYAPYPGFAPWAGAVGEYNGKFMIGQQVLRGGSVATPAGHARPSYRNFFAPDARWQFSGLRLARDA